MNGMQDSQSSLKHKQDTVGPIVQSQVYQEESVDNEHIEIPSVRRKVRNFIYSLRGFYG